MNQRELDSMTPAELLGLWSARREGAYESPIPDGLKVASYGPKDEAPRVDDEAHVAAWVEGVPEVAKYRRALVVLLGGGLMPHQVRERQTMIRQTSQVTLRTWRRWAREWELDRGTPPAVAGYALKAALEGIAKLQKWGMGPKMPDRTPNLCREDEIMAELPSIVSSAEEKFPARFATRGEGYLVASKDGGDTKYCAPRRNIWNIRGQRRTA